MILVVWIALIVLTTFYCYFCEQRLFPSKTKRLQESQVQKLSSEGGEEEKDVEEKKGHLQSNLLTATLPKEIRSRKEASLTIREKLCTPKMACGWYF